MTYQMVVDIWTAGILLSIITWSVLLFVSIAGLVKRRYALIKASIKYLVNTFSFLFAYAIYFSFAIVVMAPRGKTKEDSIRLLKSWVMQESLDWLWSGLVMIGVLAVFNAFYQLKIEKIKDNRQLVILTVLNLVVLAFGILMGAANATTGLTEEINRHIY